MDDTFVFSENVVPTRDDQLRLSSLQMAIQYHATGPSHIGTILETAKDFEKFLRGEHE